MKQLFFCGLAAAVMLAACQGTGKQASKDSTANASAVAATTMDWKLDRTHWKLKDFPGSRVQVPVTEKPIYVTFTDSSSQIQGFLGCNGFGGKFLATAKGDLQISDVVSTQMACPALDAENTLVKVMGETNRYTIEKDMLRLQKGDSILAIFTAIQP